MNELHLRRLAPGTRAGHLVLAGEHIGLTHDGTDLVEGADVVVTSVLRDGAGWRIAYLTIVRGGERPAA